MLGWGERSRQHGFASACVVQSGSGGAVRQRWCTRLPQHQQPALRDEQAGRCSRPRLPALPPRPALRRRPGAHLLSQLVCQPHARRSYWRRGRSALLETPSLANQRSRAPPRSPQVEQRGSVACGRARQRAQEGRAGPWRGGGAAAQGLCANMLWEALRSLGMSFRVASARERVKKASRRVCWDSCCPAGSWKPRASPCLLLFAQCIAVTLTRSKARQSRVRSAAGAGTLRSLLLAKRRRHLPALLWPGARTAANPPPSSWRRRPAARPAVAAATALSDFARAMVGAGARPRRQGQLPGLPSTPLAVAAGMRSLCPLSPFPPTRAHPTSWAS